MRSSLAGLLIASVNLVSTLGGSTTRDVAPLSVSVNDVKISESNFAPLSLPETMQSVHDTLRNIERMPTCQRMAHSELVRTAGRADTSNLDGKTPHVHEIMESTQRLFGARLAVCELDEAKVAIPNACKPFLPVFSAPKKRTFWAKLDRDRASEPSEMFPEYDAVTEANLEQCVSALYDLDNGQAWTSFSNGRQNAVVIFNTVRASIENDERARLDSMLVAFIPDASELPNLMRERGAEVDSMFHDITTHVRQTIIDLHQGNLERQQAATAEYDAWVQNFNAHLHDLATNIELTSARQQSTAGEIQQHLDRANTGAAELVIIQQRVVDSTDALDQSLEYMREVKVARLGNFIGRLTGDVELTERVVAGLRENATDAALVMFATYETALATNAVSIETQARMNQTDAKYEKVLSRVEKVLGLFGGDWWQAFYVVGTFSFTMIVCSLVAYAVWPKLASFSISGNIAMALATGFVLACIATFLVHSSDARDAAINTISCTPWLICCIGGIALYLLGCAYPITNFRFPTFRRRTPERTPELNYEEIEADHPGLGLLYTPPPAYAATMQGPGLPVSEPKHSEGHAGVKKWQV